MACCTGRDPKAPIATPRPDYPLAEPAAPVRYVVSDEMMDLMSIVRTELRSIMQHQEQQFELLLKGQTRLHRGMDTFQAGMDDFREHLLKLEPPVQRSLTEEPPAVAQEPAAAEVRIQGTKEETRALAVSDAEVLGDTLRDLVAGIQRDYSKLSEVQKLHVQEVAKEEKQKSAFVIEMKETKDNLDRLLTQISSRSQKIVPQEISLQVPSEAPASQSLPPEMSYTEPNEEATNNQRASQVASQDEIDRHLEMMLVGDDEGVRQKKGDVFQRIATHHYFDLTFGLLILLNALVMACEMQYHGLVAGADISYKDVSRPPLWAKEVLAVLDYIFLVLFVIELVVKMGALRRAFWRSAWNWLDFVIVAFGVLDAAFTIDIGLDPMILRLVRLVKLTRLLKMFKNASNLFVMNLILKSLSATGGTLFWSMLLLFMFQAVFGMLLGQLVLSSVTDPDIDPEVQQSLFRYYGTFTRTMFTMFEITYVNYSRAARVLTDNIGEAWAWFFVVYRSFVAFAVVQVIRAVFIQQVLKVATDDKELLIMTRDKERKSLKLKLDSLFDLFDIESSGQVGRAEFVTFLEIPKIQIFMTALDIDPRDPDSLFSLLDVGGNGTISREEFIWGAAKLRGAAQSSEIYNVLTLATRLEAKIDVLVPDQRKVRDQKSVLGTKLVSAGMVRQVSGRTAAAIAATNN